MTHDRRWTRFSEPGPAGPAGVRALAAVRGRRPEPGDAGAAPVRFPRRDRARAADDLRAQRPVGIHRARRHREDRVGHVYRTARSTFPGPVPAGRAATGRLISAASAVTRPVPHNRYRVKASGAPPFRLESLGQEYVNRISAFGILRTGSLLLVSRIVTERPYRLPGSRPGQSGRWHDERLTGPRGAGGVTRRGPCPPGHHWGMKPGRQPARG